MIFISEYLLVIAYNCFILIHFELARKASSGIFYRETARYPIKYASCLRSIRSVVPDNFNCVQVAIAVFLSLAPKLQELWLGSC